MKKSDRDYLRKNAFIIAIGAYLIFFGLILVKCIN